MLEARRGRGGCVRGDGEGILKSCIGSQEPRSREEAVGCAGGLCPLGLPALGQEAEGMGGHGLWLLLSWGQRQREEPSVPFSLRVCCAGQEARQSLAWSDSGLERLWHFWLSVVFRGHYLYWKSPFYCLLIV